MKYKKFRAIMNKLRSLHASQDRSPEAMELFQQALIYGPPEFRAQYREKLAEFGMMPKSTHVDENGEPVFTIEDVAERLGVSVEDVKKQLKKAKAETPDVDFQPTGAVHRVQ